MARRSYDQFCGLAHALDVVGERWTLLIVRELMVSPKRYSDLAAALDGIGTSLLAARVKQLESEGVVRRRLLDPPVASVVYELTTRGHELARAMVPLALWGARHFMDAARAPEESFHAEWPLVFLADRLNGTTAANLNAEYEFHIDDSVARLRVRDGEVDVVMEKSATPADAVLRCASATAAALAGGRMTVADALTAGLIQAEGQPESLAELLELLNSQLLSLSSQV
ncbi:winged helix-turn-helix transcriptional regulator [Nocardia alba]|uniref:HxlR family transcriptional regulator n=1 Tax=Nocardia alba TaxID=225051 RepID=A0A4R1FT59_9NOCA|nr:helix-turn-helix domain-containing protein [Nocardia alba]TCJ96749.1 HxlR family transcriptional regulator [Nocardia alba]